MHNHLSLINIQLIEKSEPNISCIYHTLHPSGSCLGSLISQIRIIRDDCEIERR